jgi:hypothetical protein
MKPHLTDEAIVDLALGEAAASERVHAEACAACAARAAEARAAFELARRAEVPEPSPLYWQALRSGVSRRIAAAEREPKHFGVRLPLAAAAAVLAVAVSLRSARPPARPEPPARAALPSWSALPLEEEDDGLRVLEGLALASGSLDWPADGLDGYLASLSEDESRELAEDLRRQGQGGES